MNKNLATYITLKMPTCSPAQTAYDHEEWARFYLELLTDEEYQKYGLYTPYGMGDLRPWTDNELVAKARTHTEAAKLLKTLDALHDEEEETD